MNSVPSVVEKVFMHRRAIAQLQTLNGSIADRIHRFAGCGDNAAHGEETVDQLRVIQ